MEGIFSQEGSCAKQQFRERLKWIRDAELRTRYLIVIHLLEGQTVTWISRTLKISRNTVYRTKHRYETEGESGLFDRRSENGERKVTEEFLERLVEVVAGDPQQYGWKRPTWTRELLIKTMTRQTGISIALSTMRAKHGNRLVLAGDVRNRRSLVLGRKRKKSSVCRRFKP